jgi:WD40 repeat protein
MNNMHIKRALLSIIVACLGISLFGMRDPFVQLPLLLREASDQSLTPAMIVRNRMLVAEAIEQQRIDEVCAVIQQSNISEKHKKKLQGWHRRYSLYPPGNDDNDDKKPMVTTICFSPVTQYLAAGLDNGMIVIWSTRNLHQEEPLQILNFKAHTTAITALSFSLDGQLLATGSGGGGIGLWKVFLQNNAFERIMYYAAKKTTLRSLCFSRDSCCCIFITSEKCYFFDVDSTRLVRTIQANSNTGLVTGCFSFDGSLFVLGIYAASVNKAALQLWDIKLLLRGEKILPITVGVPKFHAFCCGEEGKKLILGGQCGEIYLYDLLTLLSLDGKKVVSDNVIQNFCSHSSSATALFCSFDNHYLIARLTGGLGLYDLCDINNLDYCRPCLFVQDCCFISPYHDFALAENCYVSIWSRGCTLPLSTVNHLMDWYQHKPTRFDLSHGERDLADELPFSLVPTALRQPSSDEENFSDSDDDDSDSDLGEKMALTQMMSMSLFEQ